MSPEHEQPGKPEPAAAKLKRSFGWPFTDEYMDFVLAREYDPDYFGPDCSASSSLGRLWKQAALTGPVGRNRRVSGKQSSV